MLPTTHMAVGAAIRGGSTRLICTLVGVDNDLTHQITIYATAFGAVAGVIPDVSWWYDYAHKQFRWWYYILWECGAHVLMDIPFHQYVGWWPRLWSGDVAALLVSSGVVVYSLFWP